MLTKYKNKITFISTHRIAYQIIQEQSKVLSIGCGRGFVEYYLEKNKKCEIKNIYVINKKLGISQPPNNNKEIVIEKKNK